MAINLYDQILEAIKESKTIIVHRHKNPDPDALGSQGGLVEIIKTSFPTKKVLKAGGPVGDLNYLTDMDDVSDEDYKEALVIVTDTANTPRISDERYNQGKFLIKIDHHPNDDVYGDIVLVDTKASSSSEIIADFCFYHKEVLDMTDNAARLLYAGIVGDTGRFLYPATTPKTMRIVADLMEHPIKSDEINRKMTAMSRKVAQLSGYVLQNIEIHPSGVGKVLLTKSILDQFDVSDAETSAVVSLPSALEEVVLWGIFVEQPEGHFRCRLRSKGPVINEVAKQHHGGGHPLASGANAKDLNEVEQIIHQLIQVAEQN
ncbi:MAG: bifunctional oligoribonuclease and phosphatase NrnA [Carnobacterium sp.]|uniref:Oligoribonuclease n=2 Tax=Carnobacterium inhibens TaxID=147709 RepID=U5SB33_9LACT|nr:bifunctional oligoribonuclease/PAP phosphatase NrnA [Carnobacterium inhibens]AGY81293.1 oligoribonuclease [Carnobacterium inhibens subsp. gilichinskyi]MBC9825198.1 bifunctional oligoribonuclease/PAP phosphatase NrnA [Carnobacterium inhibens]MDN5371061.1 bifunctional oligoribonuclease and phosphatase NrnA [Carnobacterium sp.]